MLAGDLAWKAGATWDTGPPLNTGSQVVIEAMNGWTLPLYTGDVVAVGAPTPPDPTAVATAAMSGTQSPYCVGVVGGQINTPGTGGSLPNQLANVRYDQAGTTAASATVTDTSAVASDLGKGITGPGIPSGAYITAVTAGTSFTISLAATATASPVTVMVGPRPAQMGPGYIPGAFPIGDLLPVVIAGVAYVNIGTSGTIGAGSVLATSVAPRIAAGVTATLGTSIGVALEPWNGPNVVPSGDGATPPNILVRAWITKF